MSASILPFVLSLSKDVVVLGGTCFDRLSTSGVLVGGLS